MLGNGFKVSIDLCFGISKNLGEAITLFIGMKKQNEFTAGCFEYDPQISHFSDSLVISVRYCEDGEDHLLRSLGWAVNFLLSRGFLLRGAISCGQLTHKDSMIYGPALIEAYNLEKQAKWPRIILDNKLAESIGQNREVIDFNGFVIGNVKNWRVDKVDQKTFFDFLPDPSFRINDFTTIHEKSMLVIRDLIVKNLKEFETCNEIYPKYQWLAQYFNIVIEENKSLALDKIHLSRLDALS